MNLNHCFKAILASVIWGTILHAQTVLYVDRDATGANNGSSWADAHTDLQAALTAIGTNRTYEVRVAEGTYTGTTFHLASGVALMGGYAGISHTDPDARDIAAFPTILRGDQHVVSAVGVDATAVLDGFTISGGHAAYEAEGWGGGLLIDNGSPTIIDCTFASNSAFWDGGGVFVMRGSPTFTRCTFEGNSAGHDGGGLCSREGHITLVDCTFIANTAGNDGGGLCTDAHLTTAATSLTNCRFFGNSAGVGGGYGGGLWTGSPTTLVQCAFSGNRALSGGALAAFNDDITLRQCTLNGNSAEEFGGGLYAFGAHPQRSAVGSIFWDNASGMRQGEAGQMFLSAGAISVSHSCIEGWSASLSPFGGVGNLAEDPQLLDPDGADNQLGTLDDDLHLAPGSPCVDRGGSAPAGLPLFDPDGDDRVLNCRVDVGWDESIHLADCNGNAQADACDIAAGSSLDCDSNGVADECEPGCDSGPAPDACDIAGGTAADCNRNGVPDACDLAVGTSADGDGNSVPDECESAILYVHPQAAGRSNGATWADAFVGLDEAVHVALSPGSTATQIWVAAGTYRPVSDPGHSGRERSFRVRGGLALYGGFAGGETELGERDPTANLTILSGDLDDDDLSSNGYDDNSFHVLDASGADAAAVIDGFVITAGRAEGVGPKGQGGGLYLADGAPTFANLEFIGNHAVQGGAAAWIDAEPKLLNCAFRGNCALQNGGAVYNECASPPMTNCVFLGNRAGGIGGAVYIWNGGAPTLTHCTLAGNVAQDVGGVGVGYGGNVAVSNSILWANSDAGGGDAGAQIRGATLPIRYSCVQGMTSSPGGVGNFAFNPRFADLDGPDNVVGTDDDDPRLTPASPCVDAGDNDADTDAALSGLQSLPSADLDRWPRFADHPLTPDTGPSAQGPPIVDMGAHEFQDCNANRVVDSADLAMGASADVNGNSYPDECEPDCNSNGSPDSFDVVNAVGFDCNANGLLDECEARPLLASVEFLRPAAAEFDNFGFALAAGGGIAAASAPFSDTGQNSSGDVVLFESVSGTPLVTIDHPAPVASDYFGYAVAVGPGRVLVGVPQANAGTLNDSGAAHLFEAPGGALLRTFVNPSPNTGDSFGRSIALSAGHVLIGAPSDDTLQTDAGAAYLFDAQTGDLVYTLRLSNPLGAAYDGFGTAVLLTSELTLIGAPTGGAGGTGAVYAFDLSSGAPAWVRENPGPATGTWFGLVLATDGSSLAIGAPYADAGLTEVGAVHLLDVQSGIHRRTLSNPTPAAGDRFGSAVAFTGGLVVVGAPLDDSGATNAGAAHVFNPSSGAFLRTISNPSPAGYEQFGAAVAGDDGILLISAPGDSTWGTGAGAVYRSPIATDCDSDGVLDDCEMALGSAFDCQMNGVVDLCEDDCNATGKDDSCELAAGSSWDCNFNTLLDECDIAAGASVDCQTNGVPDECDLDSDRDGLPDDCEFGGGLIGAAFSKSCDLPIMLSGGRSSEPRTGGITRIAFFYAGPPPGEEVSLEVAAGCGAPPSYALYAGPSAINCFVDQGSLQCVFTPGLQNARSYRLTVPDALSGTRNVEVRGLIGDINSDGWVNGADRSLIIAVWTGDGQSCATDLNRNGITNGHDRSIVIGAWTGVGTNCAP